LRLPTFLGNHDMGRIGWFIVKARPGIGDEELLARVTLAHALLMFSRGVPTIYYGDEQGFTGAGDYGQSRHDLFETGVPAYREGRRIGGDRPPFDVSSPMYRRIAGMAGLRHELTPLRRGRQIVRAAGDAPGLYAFSRMVEGSPGEVVVIFNTGLTPLKTRVAVDPASATWRAAHGVCPTAAAAPGVIEVEIAPLDYLVCVSGDPR
jgi:glycosidase